MELKKHGRKRSFFRLFLFLALFSLSACQEIGDDVVAKIGEKEIYLEELNQADQFFQSIKQTIQDQRNQLEAGPYFEENSAEETGEDQAQEASEDLEGKRQVLDQLVYEEMIRQDPNLQITDLETRTQTLWEASIDHFGGEEGLLAQLNTYGITEQTYYQSLENQTLVEGHQEAFRAANPISNEKLEKYYDSHEDTRALVSYVEIGVPTSGVAEEIAKELASEESNFSLYEEEYNNDAYENTYVKKYENMGIMDDDLLNEELLLLEVGEVEVYYQEDLYHVVAVQEKTDDFLTLQDHLEDLVFQEEYGEYIQSLSRDLDVQIFYENVKNTSN